MPLSLAQMLALLPEQNNAEISPTDVQDVVTALYDWIPYGQKYQLGRLPGETPHADDDFFASYSGYTEVQITGTTTWAAGNNGLTATTISQSASDLNVAVKPMSTGSPPVTIETMLRFAMPINGNPGGGLIFTDGTTSASNAVGFGTLAQWNHFAPRGTLTAMSSTVVTETEYRFSMTDMTLLYRLVWTAANTWAWAISPDYGSTWTDYTSTTFSHTLTPTHIGFFATSWASAMRGLVNFPYLRVYDADLSI